MSTPDIERLHDAYARLLRQAMGEAAHPGGDNEKISDYEPAPLSENFGPYRITATLGHGGQGIVYRAIDTRLGRDVALKLLSAHSAATPTTRARFEREAAAVSRLRHPGLCTVYEAGAIDGQRYLCMELVDGPSLSQWVAQGDGADSESGTSGDRRARIAQALEIVEQVARAVHAAHRAGIVHRDLKPANVILRGDGSPVVLDFGLARDEGDSAADLTAPGDVLGTPAYMPPERVRGVQSPSDAREDVYGLGAILYECLTGKPPFAGHTREQLYRRILTERVADPRRLNASVPVEARYVVETALEKNPDSRYATAEEFANDVGRLRKREPIQARPARVWTLVMRWVQRDPRVAVPTLAAFLLLLGGVLITLTLLGRVREQSDHAIARALLAESTAEVGRNAQRALTLATEAAQRITADSPPDLHAALRSAQIQALAQAGRTQKFSHPGQAKGAAFHSDGTRLTLVLAGPDRVPDLAVYATDEPKLLDALHILKPGQTLLSCAFDHERQRVLLTTTDGTTYIVRYTDGSVQHTLTPKTSTKVQFAHSRAFGQFPLAGTLADFVPGHPDLVLTGCTDGLRLWRLDRDRTAVEVWHDARANWTRTATKSLSQIAISADGRRCACGTHAGWLRVLRVRDGALLGEAQATTETVRLLAFDPRRPLLLTTAIDELGVSVWDVDREPDPANSRLERRAGLALAGSWARQLRFAPSGKEHTTTLVVVDDNRVLRFYEPATTPTGFAQVADATVPRGFGTLRFTPDGSRVALPPGRTSAPIFDLRGRRVGELSCKEPSGILAWSRRGDRMVSTGQPGWTEIAWTVDPVFRVEHLPHRVTRLAVAGERVVVAMHNGSIGVLDPGKELRVARGRVRTMKPSFALRADGQQLAVGSNLGLYDIWDLASDRPVRRPDLDAIDFGTAPLNPSCFTYDGPNLLIAAPKRHTRPGCLVSIDARGHVVSKRDLPGYDAYGALVRQAGRTMLFWPKNAHWDLAAPTTPTPFAIDSISHPVTSGDGRHVMLASTTRHASDLILIDPAHRRIARRLSLGPATDPALSHDGSQLVVPNRKGQVKVWDLTTEPPQLLAELRGHVGSVWAARYSSDGSQIITAGDDGTVRFWPARFDGLDELVKERRIRNPGQR